MCSSPAAAAPQVYTGRADLEADPDSYLHHVAVDTPLRTLKEAVAGADVFLGLSAGNLLSPEMLLSMARCAVQLHLGREGQGEG